MRLHTYICTCVSTYTDSVHTYIHMNVHTYVLMYVCAHAFRARSADNSYTIIVCAFTAVAWVGAMWNSSAKACMWTEYRRVVDNDATPWIHAGNTARNVVRYPAGILAQPTVLTGTRTTKKCTYRLITIHMCTLEQSARLPVFSLEYDGLFFNVSTQPIQPILCVHTYVAVTEFNLQASFFCTSPSARPPRTHTTSPCLSPPKISNRNLKKCVAVDGVTIAAFFAYNGQDVERRHQQHAGQLCESIGWKLAQLRTPALFLAASGMLDRSNGTYI